jgi:cell division protein FtsL
MTPPAASAAATPAISPRRRTATPRRAPAAPRRPRRISGPATPARGQTRSAVGLAEAVATHRLLDRLIRGRIWIGVIAFALIGIVTMQLGLLKLNAGIGRSLAREAQLQRENATLSTENSELAAGERVETQAEHAGMELIPAGAIGFLAAHPSSDVSKAAAALGSSASTPAGSTTAQSGTEATSGTAATSETATASTASEATTSTTETETATSASTATGATSGTTGETGESSTTPEATTPTSTETKESSGASTETSAGGATEAASPTSESTSAGGGTTPGG